MAEVPFKMLSCYWPGMYSLDYGTYACSVAIAKLTQSLLISLREE
jgi:hypothetical protein